jgi:hypothetical protein
LKGHLSITKQIKTNKQTNKQKTTPTKSKFKLKRKTTPTKKLMMYHA